ncbi:hypothetical protein [Fictibacillus sp. NRS-1165]|uniref:hypothetical protein n=1 Tax=Fictibacillus sp. NRS-1165 TaxID=3144463 RepID=UPI003D19122C
MRSFIVHYFLDENPMAAVIWCDEESEVLSKVLLYHFEYEGLIVVVNIEEILPDINFVPFHLKGGDIH